MAIAFDAASGVSTQASGTSITLAHTCSGSDRFLFVAVWNNGTTQTFTVTYNSVSMTLLASIENATSGVETFIYGLQAPATGTNNIVVTASGTTNFNCAGASYTGVNQSVTMDATATTTEANHSATAHSISITTIADNCWVFAAVGSGSSTTTWTAGSATTARISGSVSPGIFDTNAAKTPAGSVTLNSTSNVNSRCAQVAISFAPATAVATGNFFAFF